MKAKNGSKRAMCMDEDTIAYILEQYENAPGGGFQTYRPETAGRDQGRPVAYVG